MFDEAGEGSPLPALYLTAEAINTQGKRLMGRQSAGHGFLRSFAKVHRGQGANRVLPLVCPQPGDSQMVVDVLRHEGWQPAVKHLPAGRPAQWQGFDVMHYPAPPSDRLGWQRARHRGTSAFALSGVTHTISSKAVMQQLAAYVHGPFAAWDALVCTSQSVHQAVHGIWREQLDYLAWRLGQPVRPALPMTPVIPLGVHADEFAAEPGERVAGRAQWGLEPDEVVVLFVGRLSLHAKANPLPMYLACARAAARSGCKIHVLECGWFANAAIEAAFDQAAQAAGVRVTRVDGREPGTTRRAYAAADVFMSLSDNVQETFGLTPVEAMAAGLPVVVSNWDGYRETVRDGVEGFLIETRQPAHPGCAQDLIHGYEDDLLDYDSYVAHAHLLVSVDVEACAQALATLAQDAGLRQRMGAAGRVRAQAIFDWPVVMERYQALWAEQRAKLLHQRRLEAGAPVARSNPGMPNPLRMFAHYPSDRLDQDTRISRLATAPGSGALTLAQARSLGMWDFAGSWLPRGEWLQKAWEALPMDQETGGAQMPQEAGLSVQEWALALAVPLPRAQRLAVWLHKCGLVRLTDGPSIGRNLSKEQSASPSAQPGSPA